MPVGHLSAALRKSYGWKPPLETTKSSDLSLALLMVSVVVFVLRLLWLLQLAKVLLRISDPERDIPSWLAEAYVFASLVCEVLICILLAAQVSLVSSHAELIGWICLWKATETVTSNLYYVLLRPVVERRAPQNDYRTLVLAFCGTIESWLLLSLAWYGLGETAPGRERSVSAVLYQVYAAFFSHGLAVPAPAGDFSKGLAMLSSFYALCMAGILLICAFSLARRPSDPGRP